jgi:hypothetical protein
VITAGRGGSVVTRAALVSHSCGSYVLDSARGGPPACLLPQEPVSAERRLRNRNQVSAPSTSDQLLSAHSESDKAVAGSTTETHPRSLTEQPEARLGGRRGNAGVVAGSMLSGVLVAALLCLVVFPGASEPTVTGSALLGCGAAPLSLTMAGSDPQGLLPAAN